MDGIVFIGLKNHFLLELHDWIYCKTIASRRVLGGELRLFQDRLVSRIEDLPNTIKIGFTLGPCGGWQGSAANATLEQTR